MVQDDPSSSTVPNSTKETTSSTKSPTDDTASTDMASDPISSSNTNTATTTTTATPNPTNDTQTETLFKEYMESQIKFIPTLKSKERRKVLRKLEQSIQLLKQQQQIKYCICIILERTATTRQGRIYSYFQ